MKRMKKYVIGFVAAMVLSTGLITAAFASGLLTWGGEENVQYIRETLGFLDDKLDSSNDEIERLEAELEASTNNGEIAKGLRKQIAEKEADIILLQNEIAVLNTDAAANKDKISTLESEKETLTLERDNLLATTTTLKNEKDGLDGQLQKAREDVQVLRNEAEVIRDSHSE